MMKTIAMPASLAAAIASEHGIRLGCTGTPPRGAGTWSRAIAAAIPLARRVAAVGPGIWRGDGGWRKAVLSGAAADMAGRQQRVALAITACGRDASGRWRLERAPDLGLRWPLDVAAEIGISAADAAWSQAAMEWPEVGLARHPDPEVRAIAAMIAGDAEVR